MESIIKQLPELISEENPISLSTFFEIMTIQLFEDQLLMAVGCYYLSLIFKFFELCGEPFPQKKQSLPQTLLQSQTPQIINLIQESQNEWVLIWWCYLLLYYQKPEGYQLQTPIKQLFPLQLLEQQRLQYQPVGPYHLMMIENHS